MLCNPLDPVLWLRQLKLFKNSFSVWYAWFSCHSTCSPDGCAPDPLWSCFVGVTKCKWSVTDKVCTLWALYIYKHTRTKNISISETFVNLAQIPVFGLAYANIYTELYWKIDKWALLCACMYVQYNEMTYDKPNQGNTNRSKKHLRWLYLVVLLSWKRKLEKAAQIY